MVGVHTDDDEALPGKGNGLAPTSGSQDEHPAGGDPIATQNLGLPPKETIIFDIQRPKQRGRIESVVILPDQRGQLSRWKESGQESSGDVREVFEQIGRGFEASCKQED